MSGDEENMRDLKREPEEEGAAAPETAETAEPAVVTKEERDTSEAPSVEITKEVMAQDDDAKMGEPEEETAQDEASEEEPAAEAESAQEAEASPEPDAMDEDVSEAEDAGDAEAEPEADEDDEAADEQPESSDEAGEKRASEEVTEDAAEETAQRQEEEAFFSELSRAEEANEDDASSAAPEGPQWQEVDVERLKVESTGPFAKTGGSNYFHALEDKFRSKLDDQYKNFANYTVFFTKVDNVQAAVNGVYGFDWNTEKNAKLLHTSQGFAYVAKPEFPSFREASVDDLQAIVAKEGKDNVNINGSNYFHALEDKFRKAVITHFGKESTAFICWFNKTGNVEETVNGIYGSNWNQDENAKILHRSQGFAFVIQRVEEEE